MKKIALDFITLVLPLLILGAGVLALLAEHYAPIVGIAMLVIVLFRHAHRVDMHEHFGLDRPEYPRQALLIASLVTLAGAML